MYHVDGTYVIPLISKELIIRDLYKAKIPEEKIWNMNDFHIGRIDVLITSFYKGGYSIIGNN